jgi:hypothetical protein
VESLSGTHPVRATARVRWREIVVHHVDLDVGYEPGDLPADYVEADSDWLSANRDWAL